MIKNMNTLDLSNLLTPVVELEWEIAEVDVIFTPHFEINMTCVK